MVKRSYWLVLALFGLALCGAAFVFWYTTYAHNGAEEDAVFAVKHGDVDEPITPIPRDLKLDKRKVALGRRLFHDPQLSGDSRISCAHCHNLATGGVDGLAHPVGSSKTDGKIDTLTVFNSGFNFRLFWDGRAATLEDQIDFPMNNPCEMGSTWDEVIAKLGNDKAYRRDFADIYKENINPQTVRDAIATFERSLNTPNSRFDRYLRGDKQALDSSELAGYDLFKSLGCISCHQGMNMGGNMYEKLGLVEDYFRNRGNLRKVDLGRYNLTKDEDDRYEFRVPSLRNVALTAPYLHDASASTLDAAVIIMGKYQLGVDLREEEVAKIVKFLNALTGEYDGKLLSAHQQSGAHR
ncbi:MAG: cytochrome-c peroxidase [Gallionella sp.]|nr:cytochrome-c peroxidase [Gallionella sp.]